MFSFHLLSCRKTVAFIAFNIYRRSMLPGTANLYILSERKKGKNEEKYILFGIKKEKNIQNKKM